MIMDADTCTDADDPHSKDDNDTIEDLAEEYFLFTQKSINTYLLFACCKAIRNDLRRVDGELLGGGTGVSVGVEDAGPATGGGVLWCVFLDRGVFGR